MITEHIRYCLSFYVSEYLQLLFSIVLLLLLLLFEKPSALIFQNPSILQVGLQRESDSPLRLPPGTIKPLIAKWGSFDSPEFVELSVTFSKDLSLPKFR